MPPATQSGDEGDGGAEADAEHRERDGHPSGQAVPDGSVGRGPGQGRTGAVVVGPPLNRYTPMAKPSTISRTPSAAALAYR
ncbi:hypothetical protein [Streptomyces djakartensis]|uniref:hypothetical protein n=1 Tax=Streptomyces djakartensis TaxID=68193 RepID=UPI0034E04747